MAKYIDADRLKAELDEHYRNYQSKYMETRTPYTQGLIDALDLAEQVIDSFLQEQPEKPVPNDLAEEVKRYYSDNFAYLSSDQPTLSILTNIARHFAEWGYLRAAEKYDEIEYNRQRTEESVPNDLEEAADKFAVFYDQGTCDGIAQDCFIAGAKWQAEQDEKEQADLFTIVALDAAQRAKEQMMKDIPKWHKVQRGSCFDKYTDFLLSAREGHFYCSSMEVPRDGYILLVNELERLPKEDEK